MASTPTTLVDFLSTVPPPVTRLLIELSPAIRIARNVVDTVNWSSPGGLVDSWLLLLGWWAICLLVRPVFRYLLPCALLLPWLLRSLPNRAPRSVQRPLTTEGILSTAIADIQSIQTSVPGITLPRLPEASLSATLRLVAALYIPYLFLTILFPLHILFGIAGTILITWRAAWARAIRRLLFRSAYIRFAAMMVYSFISGEKLVSPVKPSRQHKVPSSARQHRFLFEVLENQRWWMGLDWTAALLPSERPSWSINPAHATLSTLPLTTESMAQQKPKEPVAQEFHPLPPPSSFSLPEPTVVYMRNSAGRRIKMTARWKWEDAEWAVVVRKDGEASLKKQAPASPTSSKFATTNPARTGEKAGDPTSTDDEGGSGFAKAVSKFNKFRASSFSSTSTAPSSANASSPPTTPIAEAPAEGGQGTEESANAPQVGQPYTDQDGWIYGDNKWENTGPKGGIGKYTRFRRWVRIAVCTETEEEADESGNHNVGIHYQPQEAATERPTNPGAVDAPQQENPKERDGTNSDRESTKGGLRQRLTSALSGT